MGPKVLYTILVSVLLSQVATAQPGYVIERLPFNGTNADYSPSYFGNGLVFCSNRKNDMLVTYTDAEKGLPLTDLYVIEKKEGGWGLPGPLPTDIVTRFHEGPACFNADASKLYFTRNLKSGKKLGSFKEPDNYLGIFLAERADEKWVNVRAFAYNNESYSIGHPSISADGQVLFYVSDKAGGRGGTDIYFSRLTEDGWSSPKKMGGAINTSGNEMFPYITGNRLYFASDGQEGAKQLDIYYSDFISETWSEPVRLPEPLNSMSDDFGLITKDGDTGYLSSNRDGSDDIYSFRFEYPEFNGCDSLRDESNCYSFFETSSFNLDTLPLSYEWELGDGRKVRGLKAYNCYPEPGIYTINLNIVDSVTGKVFFNEASYELVIQDIRQPYINSVDTAINFNKITFDAYRTDWTDFEIDQYYWTIDDTVRSRGMFTEHLFKTTGVHKITLGITGPKDSTGNYLQACVTKYLTVIDAEQMAIWKTSGNHGQLVIGKDIGRIDGLVNVELDGDKFYIEGDPMQQFRLEILNYNRPVPLDTVLFASLGEPVMEFMLDENQYSYAIGLADEPFDLYPLYHATLNKGYSQAKVRNYSRDKVIASGEIDQLDKVVLYFDSDSYKLDEYSRKKTAKLVEYLQKSPNSIARIYGHTDATDTEENNMVLSRKRARSVYDVFNSQGIDENRLKSIGAGESKPVATNDTEEGKRLNRRAEIWIVRTDTDSITDIWPDFVSDRSEASASSEKSFTPKSNTASSVKDIWTVYFDVNSSYMNTTMKEELNDLARFLKDNPGKKAEIFAFADNRFNEDYNLWLTGRRAGRVMDYLISKGIAANRLTGKGYGSDNPVIDCADCSEEQHRLNRRVEVKITDN